MLRHVQLEPLLLILLLVQRHPDPEPVDILVARLYPHTGAPWRFCDVVAIVGGRAHLELLRLAAKNGKAGPLGIGPRGVIVEEEAATVAAVFAKGRSADAAGFRRKVGWTARVGKVDTHVLLIVGPSVHVLAVWGAYRGLSHSHVADGTGARVVLILGAAKRGGKSRLFVRGRMRGDREVAGACGATRRGKMVFLDQVTKSGGRAVKSIGRSAVAVRSCLNS